jgi:hypothetical protein
MQVCTPSSSTPTFFFPQGRPLPTFDTCTVLGLHVSAQDYSLGKLTLRNVHPTAGGSTVFGKVDARRSRYQLGTCITFFFIFIFLRIERETETESEGVKEKCWKDAATKSLCSPSICVIALAYFLLLSFVFLLKRRVPCISPILLIFFFFFFFKQNQRTTKKKKKNRTPCWLPQGEASSNDIDGERLRFASFLCQERSRVWISRYERADSAGHLCAGASDKQEQTRGYICFIISIS